MNRSLQQKRKAKCKNANESLHQEPAQPKSSWSREVEVEKENQTLKEKVGQLQDQLKDKDSLLQKETKKRRVCCKAYIDYLVELTEFQAKRQVEVEKENQALKERVYLLKVRQRRLEDELTYKIQLNEATYGRVSE
ncbi:unnamed protein product [Pleuronectes platessa]|uniref:Uncharacterized protein n=1 Tax=Pleuronectes platessa TaxID=8262 RepID=A0A9N7VMT6_PLEPL|nr:unnamed protein product [Pleuronectes platessa]